MNSSQPNQFSYPANVMNKDARGNSIRLTSRQALMSPNTYGRRRTTVTQAIATPFELRAIRLNTYLNVIINSASVSDFILLIKRALE